jgi:bifunctional ADP-heptose synthase (sugar kinase/adenylyltransferase)
MQSQCFDPIVSRYAGLRVAIVGDFCLDRYFDIDPARAETSIETGLAVHNITAVRCQPGAAGTILNNLVALGIGTIHALGIAGDDGEGFELIRALRARPGVDASRFIQSPLRRTFTYTKPLVHEPGCPPRELNRLDIKNWEPTPQALAVAVAERLHAIADSIDALILMDQVDVADTGVVTHAVLEAVAMVAARLPELPVIADSRRSLRGFPCSIFKMNAAELSLFAGQPVLDLKDVQGAAATLAKDNGRPVFVTGDVFHRPALPMLGPIDVVGAGDSVTANLAAALAAGGSLPEAMELAMAAAHCVVHQLGTTGTASVSQLRQIVVG